MSDAETHEITVTWEARAQAGAEAELRALLTDISTGILVDGAVDAYEVEAESGSFVVLERWASKQAMEQHLNSPRTQEVMPRLARLMDVSGGHAMRTLLPLHPAH